MKKIVLLLTMICLVLAAGTALGDTAKGWISNPDSLAYSLDPSSAPAQIIPHRGLMGLTEEGLAGAGGSAAGGRRDMRDSLINYLDPTYVPAERIPKTAETGVMSYDPDSLIHQISPSK